MLKKSELCQMKSWQSSWNQIFFDCADYCEDFGDGCAYKCKYNRGKDFLLDWLQSEVEE